MVTADHLNTHVDNAKERRFKAAISVHDALTERDQAERLLGGPLPESHRHSNG